MYSQYSLAVTTPSYAGYYYFLEKVVSVCGVRCVVYSSVVWLCTVQWGAGQEVEEEEE